MIPVEYYSGLSLILFAIGLYGTLAGRNIIRILMSIEIMLNAVNINMVAFSAYINEISGQIFAMFIIAIAAAEAVVGLAIIVKISRTHSNIDITKLNELRW